MKFYCVTSILFLFFLVHVKGWNWVPRSLPFRTASATETAQLNSPAVKTISVKNLFGALLLSAAFAAPSASYAIAQQYKLPPIDFKDQNRCKLVSSSIGQSNAARDKLYDVRQCDLKGQSGAGKDMSGMIASDADFSGVNFKEASISKAYARNSKFVGADFTNAVVDRVTFEGSDLKGAVFANAVLSGTVFTDANLRDTDFTDSYLGPFDLRNLCANPTLTGKNPTTGVNTKESAGCLE